MDGNGLRVSNGAYETSDSFEEKNRRGGKTLEAPKFNEKTLLFRNVKCLREWVTNRDGK